MLRPYIKISLEIQKNSRFKKVEKYCNQQLRHMVVEKESVKEKYNIEAITNDTSCTLANQINIVDYKEI